MTGVKRGIGAAVLALAVAGLAGCCSCPPAAEYFDLGTPFNTVNGFAYAVRCGQWDFVHECVSTEDRELHDITPFKIRIGLAIFEHPRFKIPIKEIILRAERSRRHCPDPEPEETEAVFWTWYEGATGDGIPILLPVKIHLVDEGDGEGARWRIRFEKTVREAF